MAHMVETMAWSGEVPWHGLGVQVGDSLTPQEMLEAASLDWTVSKRPLYTLQEPLLADSDQDAGTGTLRVQKFSALVRDSDNKTLGVCGNQYIPLQNKDVFQFFDKFVKAGHMKMDTAGSLDGGRQVWGLASIQQGFTLPGGDEVRGYLLLANPHVWGESMRILFTPIRVVCNNTLTMALRDASGKGFRLPHVREFNADLMQSAEEALGIATSQLEAFEEQAKFLSSVETTDENEFEYLARLFQPELLKVASEQPIQLRLKRTAERVHELIRTQPGADLKSSQNTYWGLFNAVTYAVDHELGRDRDASLTSAWFGQRATTKAKALDLALEMAKAA